MKTDIYNVVMAVFITLWFLGMGYLKPDLSLPFDNDVAYKVLLQIAATCTLLNCSLLLKSLLGLDK